MSDQGGRACWFCEGGEEVRERIREYAYIEQPMRAVLSAHPTCVKTHAAAELVVIAEAA